MLESDRLLVYDGTDFAPVELPAEILELTADHDHPHSVPWKPEVRGRQPPVTDRIVDVDGVEDARNLAASDP